MGGRINTVMQTCFFAIAGILPQDEAIAKIKESIKKTYGSKGDAIVQKNYEAIDKTLANLYEVKVPMNANSDFHRLPAVPVEAPSFVQRVTAPIIAGLGGDLPVSAMPYDGTFPTGTAQWEKRNIALEIPAWDQEVCIQCAKCAMVCPHAAIRMKVYDSRELAEAPPTFKSVDYKGTEFPGMKITYQVAPKTAQAAVSVSTCVPPRSKKETRLKAINMVPQPPVRKPRQKTMTSSSICLSTTAGR